MLYYITYMTEDEPYAYQEYEDIVTYEYLMEMQEDENIFGLTCKEV